MGRTATIAQPATAAITVATAPRWALPTALLVGVLPYLNSLNAFWVGDDYNYVVPKTLPTVLNFFNPLGRAVYRPLNWLSWVLDYALFGPEPLGWKLTSLALHLITTALIFLLLRELLAVWTAQGQALAACPFATWLPFLGAALFAVHPAHPETVTWTGGRADVAFAPFLFLAAWTFVRWRRSGGKLLYALAFAGVVGAVLGKEAGLVAAPALLLIDVVALGHSLRGAANLLRLARDHALFWLIPALYVLLRLYLYFSGQGRLAYGVETHLQFGGGLINAALGYILLALGWWQAPGFVFTWPLLLNLGMVVVALLVALLAVRWLHRPALFALLWMPVTVAVTYDGATPRWFYAASFGICLLVALAIVRLATPRTRTVAAVLAVALLAAWSLVTAEYNARWYVSGEVARGLIADIRRLHPDPPRPATFYMGNAPYSYDGVLLFNSGFALAPAYAYQDYSHITGYELQEHAAHVKAALDDPTKLGPNPFYLRYENGHIVDYPSLAALVAAQGR